MMSEPRVIEGYGAAELAAMLEEQLADDKRPLRQIVDEAIQEAEAARTRSRERMNARDEAEGDENEVPGVASLLESPPSELFRQRQEGVIPPAFEVASKKDPERDGLRRLADIGLREFNAQLYIVQSKLEA